MSLRQFVDYKDTRDAEHEPCRRDVKRATNRLDRRADKAALRNLRYRSIARSQHETIQS